MPTAEEGCRHLCLLLRKAAQAPMPTEKHYESLGLGESRHSWMDFLAVSFVVDLVLHSSFSR